MSKKKHDESQWEGVKTLDLGSSIGIMADGIAVGVGELGEMLTISFMTLILDEPHVFSRVVLTKSRVEHLVKQLNNSLKKMK